MKLTQRETDALLRAWRDQLSRQQSPVAQAKLTAILRDLQEHDPATVRRWLIEGGDLEAHFDGTAQAAKSVAKEMANELATEFAGSTDADPLDQTVAAPFYVYDSPDNRARSSEPPRSAPQRPARSTAAPRLGTPPAAQPDSVFDVERSDTLQPWDARHATPQQETVQNPGWRKFGALACGVMMWVSQTVLLVAVLSAAYVWQTGAEVSREFFFIGGAGCLMLTFFWSAWRTYRRFSTLNANTAMPLTEVRGLKLVLLPLCIGVVLTLISEFGQPLLTANGINSSYLTLTVLSMALIANTLYFHSVPVLRDTAKRTASRWWSGI